MSSFWCVQLNKHSNKAFADMCFYANMLINVILVSPFFGKLTKGHDFAVKLQVPCFAAKWRFKSFFLLHEMRKSLQKCVAMFQIIVLQQLPNCLKVMMSSTAFRLIHVIHKVPFHAPFVCIHCSTHVTSKLLWWLFIFRIIFAFRILNVYAGHFHLWFYY